MKGFTKPIDTVTGTVLLTLPWLNPFAPGPSAAVVPWLVSAACIAVFLSVVGVTPGRPARADAWAEAITGSWLLAALVSSVIGLCQYFGVAQHMTPWVNVPPTGEAFGNLRQRNQLATLLAIGLAAWLWGREVPRRWAPSVVAIALLAGAAAASASRTGFLQLLLILVLSAWWAGSAHRWRLRQAALAVAVYAVFAWALPRLLRGLTGAAPADVWGRWAGVGGCESRLVLWSNVIDLIAQRPWLGWGWGELDYAHYSTLYDGPRFCDILDNAHNLPLHLAVELGVPVAALAVLALLWLVVRARPWRETDPQRQLAWVVLGVIGVHSLLEYPLWYGPFQIAAGLSVWRLCWSPSMELAADRPASPVRRQGLQVLCAAALILVAYAGWDYRRVSQIYLPPEQRLPTYRDHTLAQVRQSWLFSGQARFAELTITPLTRANAQWTFDTATALLHYSPEPRVIEKVIESATMLGRDDEAVAHLMRYRAAFPADYQAWRKVQLGPREPRPGG